MENKEVIITFETLFEILKKEKQKEELQRLEKTFLPDLVNYLRTKRSILESQKTKESIFASAEVEKTSKQLHNTVKMIRELYDRRETKIVQAALFSARTEKRYIDSSAMLPEETKMFNELAAVLGSQRLLLLNKILEGELPGMGQPQSLKREEHQAVPEGFLRAVADIPQFVFSDMNIYGPFSKGEEITVPEEVGKFLQDKKQVERT